MNKIMIQSQNNTVRMRHGTQQKRKWNKHTQWIWARTVALRIIADISWQTFSDFRYMELIKHRVIARTDTKSRADGRMDEVGRGGQGEKDEKGYTQK